jgi:hypothetical protein
MRFRRIVGPAHTRYCSGCFRLGVAGNEPYTSAATGESRKPEEWYISEDVGPFCSTCAAKLVEGDLTQTVLRYDGTIAHSTTQFYADTKGNFQNLI